MNEPFESNIYKELPDELIEHINTFLKKNELLMASLASKRHLTFGVNNEKIWKGLIEREYGDPDFLKEKVKKTFQQMLTFKQIYQALKSITEKQRMIRTKPQTFFTINIFNQEHELRFNSRIDLAANFGLDVIVKEELDHGKRFTSVKGLEKYVNRAIIHCSQDKMNRLFNLDSDPAAQDFIKIFLCSILTNSIITTIGLKESEDVIINRLTFILKQNLPLDLNRSIPFHTPNGELEKMPLHWSIENDLIQVTKYLIDNGAKVHILDECGKTPLHYAAGKASPEIIELLLKKQVDIEALDHSGLKPIDCLPHDKNNERLRRLLTPITSVTYVEHSEENTINLLST